MARRLQDLACFVCRTIIHVNSMKYVAASHETGIATRVDRWVDRAVSIRNDEAAYEVSFEAAAGSAPRIQRVARSRPPGESAVRTPAPLPGHPLPTTGLGGREVVQVRRDDGSGS